MFYRILLFPFRVGLEIRNFGGGLQGVPASEVKAVGSVLAFGDKAFLIISTLPFKNSVCLDMLTLFSVLPCTKVSAGNF